MGVEVQPMTAAHRPQLAGWLVERVRRLDALAPGTVFDLASAEQTIDRLMHDGVALVAIDHDQVVGHLGWFEFPTFRRAARPAAWIPEFGLSTGGVDVLELLYLAASQRWDVTGRQVASVTLFADDGEMEDWWITNGFGRFLHDTVRACSAIDHPPVEGCIIRAATLDDADQLEALDVDHCAHYRSPPIFMVPFAPTTAGEWARMVESAPEAVWVADDGRELLGFIKFEPTTEGLAVLRASDSVTVTGIFTRPTTRGRGLATALLSAGMEAHQRRGMTRVAIDHETTNPQARKFWPRHTTTVAVSLMRVLERP